MDCKCLDFKVKCSNVSCSYVYHINDIVFPLINDKGYAIYECPQCHAKTRICVCNTDVHLNRRDCVGVYEDGEEYDYPSLAAIPIGERNDTQERHDYYVAKVSVWKDKDIDYEENAYSVLEKHKDKIEEVLCGLQNAYLANQIWAKDIEKLLFKVWIDDTQYVLLQNSIVRDKFTMENLLPIGISGVSISDVVNGVYPRDACFSMIDYLLHRWNLLCKQVIFASPYIGFVQKTTIYNEQIRNFWEWLGETLDMDKTLFITKKATFTRFKAAMEELGIDFDNEKTWDSLSKLVKVADEYDGRRKEAKLSRVQFYQQFHAKFYAGVFDDHVEVLVGSYNIHQGLTLENLVVEQYGVEEFEEKYLKPFNKGLSSAESTETYYQVGFVEVDGDEVNCKVLGKGDYINETILCIK